MRRRAGALRMCCSGATAPALYNTVAWSGARIARLGARGFEAPVCTERTAMLTPFVAQRGETPGKWRAEFFRGCMLAFHGRPDLLRLWGDADQALEAVAEEVEVPEPRCLEVQERAQLVACPRRRHAVPSRAAPARPPASHLAAPGAAKPPLTTIALAAALPSGHAPDGFGSCGDIITILKTIDYSTRVSVRTDFSGGVEVFPPIPRTKLCRGRSMTTRHTPSI